MRIIEIKNKGAIPFPEEISWKPGDDPKIAIVGDNGSGKSTLLDTICMAFYGITPNRKSESGRDDGAIYGCFKDPKSSIEVKMLLNGKEILVKRLINPVSKTQKPYLYVNGKAVTEGKVKEFAEEFLKETGLSQEVFLSTVYHSQKGKGHLSSLDQGSARQLLDQLLGFEEYDREFSLVDSVRKTLEQDIQGEQFATKELENTVSTKVAATQSLKDAEESLAVVKENFTTAEAIHRKQVQKVADLKADSFDVSELMKNQTASESKLNSLSAEIDDITTRLENNKKLLDSAESIRAKAKELEELESKIESFSKDLEMAKSQYETQAESLKSGFKEKESKLNETRSTKDQLTVKFKELDSKKSTTTSQIKVLKSKLESNQSKVSLLERVPCNGVEVAGKKLNESCELLKDAISGKEQIVLLEGQIKGLEREFSELLLQEESLSSEQEKIQSEAAKLSQEIYDIQEEIDNSPLRAKIKELESLISTLKVGIPPLKEETRNLDKLDLAQERIDDYQAKLDSLSREKSSLDEELRAIADKLESKKDTLAVILKEESELNKMESEMQKLRQQSDFYLSQIGIFKARMEVIEEAEGKLKKLKNSTKAQRLTLLKLLCEGLSPKGARALKLDAAGPGISACINSILAECYGSRFQVSLRTTKTTGKGDIREDFSLMVLDEETGEESPVENKSGGEAAIIKEGISLGTAVYKQQVSGTEIKTLIRDEADGGLTSKNAHLYQKMLDKAMKVGGFEQVIYVSHKPEIQRLATKTYRVANNRIQLEEAI